MANVRFILRNPDAYAMQSVYVTARFGRNEKLMYSLPIKVELQYWDATRQRVKPSIYCKYADDVNEALSEIASRIEKFMVDSVRDGGGITKRDLKNVLDIHFGRKKACDDFHSFFESYIEECDYRTSPVRGGQTVSYTTKRKYIQAYRCIKEFERERDVVLAFSDITPGMLADWVRFLQWKNLSVNTIALKVMAVKAVMRAAVERGLTDNQKWQFFRNSREETDALSLNEKELESIKRLDLSKSPHLDRVRDMFLAGCWTGLRFSDLTRIKTEDISDGLISIRQQKTGSLVTIPVHPVFMEVWGKYGGSLPHAISNQKFNQYIKEVCKRADLTGPFFRSLTRGGRLETTKCEKWEAVSSHTARRTFATNLYKSGFPSISIMQITGHKTESAFLKYIKVSKQEHARMLADHWRKRVQDGKDGGDDAEGG